MADVALPGALRRAVMRIGADAGIGELHHVGTADQDEARSAQAGHRRRIAVSRRAVVERARTGAGDLALDIEQVLDRNRNAGEARRGGMGLAQRVHRVGSGERGILVDMDIDPLPLAVRVCDFGETVLDQLAGGGAAG